MDVLDETEKRAKISFGDKVQFTLKNKVIDGKLYVDHEIRFYSESNFEYKEKVTKNSNKSVRYVYTLIIVMLLVSIIFLYVIKKNNIL